MDLKYICIFLVYIKFKYITEHYGSLFIYHQKSSVGSTDFRNTELIKSVYAVEHKWQTCQKKKKKNKY